jgi:hypothetical protein
MMLAIFAVVCVAWYVVATIRIFDDLRRRGEKVNFILIRLLAPWYASRYRELTRKETGRTGGLFYQWVVSINLTAVLIAAAILIHRFS